VWCLLSSFNKSLDSRRHTRGSGYPDIFGFSRIPARASYAGMTFGLLNELRDADTSPDIYWQTRINGRLSGSKAEV
jgi:hypothetical protein